MPTNEIIVTPGSKIEAGTSNNRLNILTIGTFNISKTIFAIKRDAIRPHTTSGLSVNSSGPGVIFKVIRRANKTAVVPEPGTPNVSMGTNAPPAAALFPASGAAIPRGSPFPNWDLSELDDFSNI